jgi:HNH endonuclease
MAKDPIDNSKLDRVIAEQRQYIAQREKGYREQALKLYPWICGRCTREFTRANLKELTVHHINHNHDDNPSDGSNWELLCIYCHDEEHSKFENFIRYGPTTATKQKPATFNPFAGLKESLAEQQKKK